MHLSLAFSSAPESCLQWMVGQWTVGQLALQVCAALASCPAPTCPTAGDRTGSPSEVLSLCWPLARPSSRSSTRGHSGSTLIRAKTNQDKEGGNTGFSRGQQQPVNLETLLKTFTGRRYTNVTGEAPSATQMAQDLAPTDVSVAPDESRQRPDDGHGRAVPKRLATKPRSLQQQPSGLPAEQGSLQQQPSGLPAEQVSLQQQPSGLPAEQGSLQQQLSGLPTEQGQHRELPGQPVGRMNPPTPGGTPGPGSVLPGRHSGPHRDDKGDFFTWTQRGERLEVDWSERIKFFIVFIFFGVIR